MGDDNFHFQAHHQHYEQQQEEEQEQEVEEALSLSDFPIHDDHLPMTSDNNDIEKTPIGEFSDSRHRRSSSQPQDFFEFFSDSFVSDHAMCLADDIIICGKLVPFKEPYRSATPSGSSNPFAVKIQEEEENERKPQIISKTTTLGLRSRSVSSCNYSHSHSPKTKLTRNSRSLDYRKLNRVSSSVSNSPEAAAKTDSPSVRSTGKAGSDVSAKRAIITRPRWSVFMFGIVKFPAEMELEDIKTRQLRRNPTTIFVPKTTTMTNEMAAAATNVPVGGRRNYKAGSSSSSWKLLKALSCKDHSSVAVTATTSLACLPQSASFA